jgi:hypothetical protein
VGALAAAPHVRLEGEQEAVAAGGGDWVDGGEVERKKEKGKVPEL